MFFNSLSPWRSSRRVLFSALSLTGALVLAGCGGGSGGPSGGGGGGTTSGNTTSGGTTDGGGGGNGLSTNSLVFISNRDGNAEVYRGNINGTNEVRLTNSAGNEATPFISRNRIFVVYSSDRDGNNEIYRYNLGDGTEQRFTADRLDVSDTVPVVSSDSRRIAWVSERGGSFNVWIMDATGANQTQVTTNGGNLPTFSSDGTQIAYVNPANNIVVRTLADNTERTITTGLPTSSPITLLKWSPNGTSIAFTAAGTTRIIAATATDTNSATNFGLNSGSGTGFSWGPDSTRAAYVLSTNGTANVYSAASVSATVGTQITAQGSNSSVSWTN